VPPTSVVFQQLGISLLLGLLVGLQRQHTTLGMPGMRTFPLITVFGSVSALLALEFGGWIIAAGLLGIVAVLVFGWMPPREPYSMVKPFPANRVSATL